MRADDELTELQAEDLRREVRLKAESVTRLALYRPPSVRAVGGEHDRERRQGLQKGMVPAAFRSLMPTDPAA